MVELFEYETQFDLSKMRGKTECGIIKPSALKALIHGAQEWYDHIYECARWQKGGLVEWYEDDEESIREFRAVTAALTFMLKDDSTRTFPDP